MPFTQFDRKRLHLKPLSQREHEIRLDIMLDKDALPEYRHPTIALLADRICAAKAAGRPIMMMMGGHVIRSGAAPLLIQLMKEGLITHLALNGAACIHDFELAMIGATTESVARYITEGQFGLWEEDELFNQAVNRGVRDGLGFGESLGKYIEENHFPHRDVSLLAAAYRHQVPLTAHVGIGSDIVHELPNAGGAAIGEGSFRDFLIYVNTVEHLEGGVFLNFGSAVTGPEVYLKALSMARNVKKQKGEEIRHFTTAVFDLLPLENENIHETPLKSDPRYYFRPWKTILARTVADGGESHYIQGEHRDTVACLYRELMEKDKT